MPPLSLTYWINANSSFVASNVVAALIMPELNSVMASNAAILQLDELINVFIRCLMR